jgi:hypothetical protein
MALSIQKNKIQTFLPWMANNFNALQHNLWRMLGIWLLMTTFLIVWWKFQ